MPPSASAAATGAASPRWRKVTIADLSLPPRPLRLALGMLAAAAIAALVAGLFVAVLDASVTGTPARPVPIAELLGMTTLQAALSTVLSLLAGTGIAWALNRLHFPGRALLVGLFAAAIVTPGMVVAFGLISVWGRSGWVSASVEAITGGRPDISIYGLQGILFAHVILDGALAARMLLARLDAVPVNRLKTGRSLGLDAWSRFCLIDWPAMRGTLPGLAAIIFLLAFTSFPIVLLLGGGPANQTLEVAIYSAVRLDFDLQAGVTLALVQLAACGLVILAASALPPARLVVIGRSNASLWPDRPPARLLQGALLALATLAFALPLLAVLADGLGPALPPLLARASFWQGLVTSIGVGAASAALTLVLALAIASARAGTSAMPLRVLIGLPAFAYLAVPAVVLSLGFFLALRGLGVAPEAFAAPVVILANALLALPFAVATLGPPLDTIARSRGRLIRSLGLGGVAQARWVEWPLLGRDIGVVLAMSFCFSLGDLGVIALFGTQDFATLPLLMYRALGAYRTGDAAAIAALLLLIAVAVFTLLPPLFERLGRARA